MQDAIQASLMMLESMSSIHFSLTPLQLKAHLEHQAGRFQLQVFAGDNHGSLTICGSLFVIDVASLDNNAIR